MKKLIFSVFLFIVFLGTQIFFNLQRKIPELSYIDTNMGELQYQLKPYEKNLLYSRYIKLYTLEQERYSNQQTEASPEENRLRKDFNKRLNTLTQKYLVPATFIDDFDEEEIQINSMDQEEYSWDLIAKLAKYIRPDDQAKIEKFYSEYLKEYDYQQMEEIRGVLLVYPELKADIITEQIENPVEIKAYFELTEDKELIPTDLQPILRKLPEGEELAQYQNLWSDVRKALSVEMLTKVNTFIVYTDGRDNTIAFVNSLGKSDENWYLATDVLDSYDENGLTKDFYFTVVHEYGHILTLSKDQVSYEKEPIYGTYFEGDMVAEEDSYLNQFYLRFWKDIFEDGNVSYHSDSEENQWLFFLRHERDFPTEYGSTILSEDICESFSYFVMDSKPVGNTMKEQKIRFFYEFPELVQVRKQIRSNLNMVDQ